MSEKDKFDGQKQKLENLCEEHKLTYSLQLETYPVTLTLRPLQGMYEQLSMLEQEKAETRISPDAYMTFSSRDAEYIIKSFGTFTMPEVLQTKFKNIFKKIDLFWKHYFFRECIETGAIRMGLMPEIDDEDGAMQEYDPPEDDDGEDPEDDIGPADDTADDELIGQATQVVRQANACSTSLLQRQLKLGYSKALHLIDLLEERGVVGPYKGSEPREVLPYDLPDDGEAEE